MGRMALAAVAAAVVVVASGPAAALDVCVEGNYPPFSEISADGTLVGFDIDFAGELCKRVGESCTLVQESWGLLIPSLIADKCDAIVASMSDTPDRRRLIDFTVPYYKAPIRFVGLASVALDDTPEGLAGKMVGVQRGTINQTFMQAHYPAATLRLYGNQEHVLLDLSIGRLDAVAGEAVQLDAGFLDTPAGQGFAFFGGPHYDAAIQGAGVAIGVRKNDDALRDKLDAAIAATRSDGTYDAIAKRYFDFDIYGS